MRQPDKRFSSWLTLLHRPAVLLQMKGRRGVEGEEEGRGEGMRRGEGREREKGRRGKDRR